jgi:DNA-binding Xre family transcriptional regulator
MSKQGQYMFDDMCKRYSFLTDDAIEWHVTKPGEIVVTLGDGSKVRYDFGEHRYTVLSKNIAVEDERYFMSEEECRHEFARRLRSCMRDRGMTQTMLSDLTDISQVTMSKYINGKALPGYYNISRLARALRCSVKELMVSE